MSPFLLTIGLGTVSGTITAPLLRGLGLSLYPSPIKLPSRKPQRRFRDGFRRKEALSRRPRHELHARLPVNGTRDGPGSPPEGGKSSRKLNSEETVTSLRPPKVEKRRTETLEGPVIGIDNEDGVFVLRLLQDTEAFQEPQFAEFGENRPNWEWDADVLSWRVQDINFEELWETVNNIPNVMIRAIPADWEVLVRRLPRIPRQPS